MTLEEQVTMLREALLAVRKLAEERWVSQRVMREVNAALAATAEPATPTYSADDLRKVAEAVLGAAYTPGRIVRPIDLDAIIAKAVGRE